MTEKASVADKVLFEESKAGFLKGWSSNDKIYITWEIPMDSYSMCTKNTCQTWGKDSA